MARGLPGFTERFAKANANLKGDQLDEALKKQTWDDSVKSLVSFPQVLTMMNEKLDWTQNLGDAFLASEKGVLDAVQRLRAKAQAEGNLKSTPEQIVATEPAPPPPPGQVVVQQAPAQIITIQPTNPQTVYVPSYPPTAAYGPTWAPPSKLATRCAFPPESPPSTTAAGDSLAWMRSDMPRSWSPSASATTPGFGPAVESTQDLRRRGVDARDEEARNRRDRPRVAATGSLAAATAASNS